MELRHLRYFTAVAEELNFRRAAARLHLSTPTLSQQIKDLEDELGVQLLERDTTRVRLTGPGELFLRDAREILALAQRAVAKAGEAGAGRRGTLRIGNAGPLSHGFMPACLQAFARKYPDVEVVLVEVDLNEQAAAVKTGAIQIGFTLRPGDAAGLERHPVVDASLRALLGTGHPLARQKTIALADLAAQRLLAIGGTKVSSHAELIGRVFTGRGLKAPAPRPVNGYEAFLAMVASGQGVSLLHKTPSLGSIETLTTRPLKESGPDLRLQASAIWSARPADSIVENFVGVLRTIRPAVQAGPPKRRGQGMRSLDQAMRSRSGPGVK